MKSGWHRTGIPSTLRQTAHNSSTGSAAPSDKKSSTNAGSSPCVDLKSGPMLTCADNSCRRPTRHGRALERTHAKARPHSRLVGAKRDVHSAAGRHLLELNKDNPLVHPRCLEQHDTLA